MSIQPDVNLRIIDEMPRIVDASDDGAPLMDINFHNEWRDWYDKLNEQQKVTVGAALKDIILAAMSDAEWRNA